MMFKFDSDMFQYCDSKELIYTRYADDIFVSSIAPDMLRGVEAKIGQIKRKIPHLGLRLNHQKTSHLSKKNVRRITGVIITTDHKLSIGRERKREIKSLIHHWCNNELEPEKLFYMRGLLAFARDIEPVFEDRLRRKYGNRVIDEILRHPSLQLLPDKEYRF